MSEKLFNRIALYIAYLMVIVFVPLGFYNMPNVMKREDDTLLERWFQGFASLYFYFLGTALLILIIYGGWCLIDLYLTEKEKKSEALKEPTVPQVSMDFTQSGKKKKEKKHSK